MYKSGSMEETFAIGQETGRHLRPGDFVAVKGELGAGKTVFVKGIAVSLGISEMITSPTFTFVNTYTGAVDFCHFDMYRIGSEAEAEEIGFSEYCGGSAVCVVEWPERVSGLLPPDRTDVIIEKEPEMGPDFRKIYIDRRGGK